MNGLHGPAPLWVGVDLGTQSVKVSVVDGSGSVLAATSAPLRSGRDGALHEQDPAEWIAQTRQAVASALGSIEASDRARIGGLAICATSGTIATVDSAGAPRSTGIMYDDARASALRDEVAASDPELWERLGYRIQPTWALPKVVWADRNGLLPSGTFIAHQADVVAASIVGTRVATDWSQALKTGYNTIDLEWPTAALASLGIDFSVLPEVVAPGTPLGTVSAEWAHATGLPTEATIYAGMTDGCAAQLGAAAFGLGDWHSVLGTTLVAKGVSQHIVKDDAGAVYSHRAPHDGLWLPGGASNAGAGVLTQLLPNVDLQALTGQLGDTKLSDLPLTYPLTGRGERFPVLQPDAEGFTIIDGTERALTSHAAAPAELFGAVLLGVALVERLSVETMAAVGVPVDGRFSSSGGGTRNAWWTRLRADLLNRPLTIPASAEGSVGMAILAAWAAGDNELPYVAANMSRTARVVEPDPTNNAELDDIYARFRSLLITKGWNVA